MADGQRTGSCVICAERNPLPDLEPCCGPCRSRVAGQLREIPLLCLLLAAGPRPQLTAGEHVEVRELVAELGPDDALELAGVDEDLVARYRSLVRVHGATSAVLEAGPVPGQSSAPRVRGSRERPMPINADATDLLDVADERMVSDYHHVPMVRSTGETRWQVTWFDGKPIRQEVRVREVVETPRMSRCRCGSPELHERHRPVMVPAADQVGRLSVASVLNAWVRDFAELRREVGPEPTVGLLCRYLGDRLDWAYTEHDAVDEFAGEVGDVWHALRNAAGLPRPLPEVCWGVQCRDEDCSYTNTLVRLPGSEWIECTECGLLLSESEYRAWVKLLAAAERTKT